MYRIRNFFILAASLILLVSCSSFAKKSAKRFAKQTGKEATEQVLQEMVEIGERRTLKELATSSKLMKTLFDGLESIVSRDFADGIVVTKLSDGIIELVSKDFPASKIMMNLKTNTIECAAGSLKNAGPVNQFLNYLLPNTTYKVDGCFTYITDNLGRVKTALGDRSLASSTIQRNTQRNSDVQKMVIDMLDGNRALDDGGHIFSNTSGGPNELINQVPMLRTSNQHGKWRELERIEEEAIKAGKKVVSERKFLYKGNSTRPYAIEFTYIINGQKMTTVVKNTQ